MVLTRSQARSFYDRFGRKQDTQAFYEDAAIKDLIAHSKFERAEALFELGCGTGRLALDLLTTHLPPSASYCGADLSRTMVALAEQRLAPYAERARVVHTDGLTRPLPGGSFDRFVSTYVLDLLSDADIHRAVSKAHAALVPGGKLCLVSLTTGVTPASRIVSTLWSAVCTVHASLVGGCRPIQLGSFINPRYWSVEYRNVGSQFGVPSEVLVAHSLRGERT